MGLLIPTESQANFLPTFGPGLVHGHKKCPLSRALSVNRLIWMATSGVNYSETIVVRPCAARSFCTSSMLRDFLPFGSVTTFGAAGRPPR